jgi:carboxypeptidase T
MTNRTVVRLSGALLTVFVLGCGDDDPSAPSGPFLEVSPLFRGIEEGESVQLTATLAGQTVPVTWQSSNTAKVTVSPTGLVTGVDACAGEPVTTPPCGSGFVAVTATMTSDASQQRSASITVIKLQGIGLTSGVPVTGLSSSGARGSGVLYRIRVPTGATSLTVTLRGGTGDADIYVQRQTPPDNSGDATCVSFNAGNNEDCVIDDPASGTWYILIDLWDPYAGATLTATVAP